MTTALATHQWVRMTSEPVVVISDPDDGQLYVEPLEPNSCGEVVGCECCGVTLGPDTASTLCSP